MGCEGNTETLRCVHIVPNRIVSYRETGRRLQSRSRRRGGYGMGYTKKQYSEARRKYSFDK